MDLRRFVVAEFLGYVACDSPVRILVYGGRYEGGHVFTCKFLMDKARSCLDGWPEDPSDVGAFLEPKTGARG